MKCFFSCRHVIKQNISTTRALTLLLGIHQMQPVVRILFAQVKTHGFPFTLRYAWSVGLCGATALFPSHVTRKTNVRNFRVHWLLPTFRFLKRGDISFTVNQRTAPRAVTRYQTRYQLRLSVFAANAQNARSGAPRAQMTDPGRGYFQPRIKKFGKVDMR